MVLIGFLFLCLISEGVLCWNSTGKYMRVDNGDAQTRQSRLFSFNTIDDEIVVELDFAVPFIKIPVKKSMEMAKGSMANINLGALVLVGVVTFGAAVVVPALLSILNTKLLVPHPLLGASSYSSPYRNIAVAWQPPTTHAMGLDQGRGWDPQPSYHKRPYVACTSAHVRMEPPSKTASVITKI